MQLSMRRQACQTGRCWCAAASGAVAAAAFRVLCNVLTYEYGASDERFLSDNLLFTERSAGAGRTGCARSTWGARTGTRSAVVV
jgi:hypothetical protein